VLRRCDDADISPARVLLKHRPYRGYVKREILRSGDELLVELGDSVAKGRAVGDMGQVYVPKQVERHC
jgi:hypothetical protein